MSEVHISIVDSFAPCTRAVDISRYDMSRYVTDLLVEQMSMLIQIMFLYIS